jgi:ribosomal protein L7Ae-like RNA K-turn-binding protein
MEMEKRLAINDYFDHRLNQLKMASYKGDVVKGLREVIRLIKNGRAEEVFLALGDDLGDKNALNLLKARQEVLRDEKKVEKPTIIVLPESLFFK